MYHPIFFAPTRTSIKRKSLSLQQEATTDMQKRIIYIIIVVIIALSIVYYIFDPAEYGWFPGCIIEWATGFECPACGTQRMVHALLHGDIRTALLLNPFMLVVLMPMIALLTIAFISPKGKLEWLKKFIAHPITLIVLFLLLNGWWILRNTPLWHNFIATYN